MRWYVINLLCAFDQLLNALLGGFCDESLSSHSYRLWRDRKPWGGLPPPAYEEEGREGPDHQPVFTVLVRLENGDGAIRAQWHIRGAAGVATGSRWTG